MRKAAIILFLLFLPTIPMAAESPVFAEDPIPIVFVPGFAGSTLVDSKGAVKWLDALEGLGLKTPSLALPLVWENGVQLRDDLKPGDVLRRVDMLLGLIGEDVYGPWLDAVGKLKRPVYPFVYDWRRDPLEINEEFTAFLARIRAEYPGKKIDIVGHSLGALYVMAAVNRAPELFNQAIMVGAPFSGDLNAFMNIHEGDSTGLNDDILSPEVMFSFPSVYVFLPDKESRISDKDGIPKDIDFYSSKDWKTYGFGPFQTANDPEQVEKMETFLQTALAHARQFRRLLEPRKIVYPKIRIVSGNTIPTPTLAVWDNPGKGGLDFDAYPPEKGDGETNIEDSLPPNGIPYELYYSDKSHIHLMDSPIIIKLLNSPLP